MSPRKILSATAAARILDVDTTTFQRWVERGRAPEAEFTAKNGDFWLEETIKEYAAELAEEAA